MPIVTHFRKYLEQYMHDIEPFFKWRDQYVASLDKKSPFYERDYDEFTFTNKIYNYFIHPQWDDIGSNTLFAKILFTDYSKHFSIIELIGEWNDCIENDIMTLRQNLLDPLFDQGIYKFILCMDNVYNFHADEDDYYMELYENLSEEEGYLCLVNSSEHVENEMARARLQYYIHFGAALNDIDWRSKSPNHFYKEVDRIVMRGTQRLK
ncbi:MAG TPA: hypothetical protein PK246_10220 [Saprospiraceae bacterium]|nr:hypothetical protein [Saprospiraceae bacterium]